MWGYVKDNAATHRFTAELKCSGTYRAGHTSTLVTTPIHRSRADCPVPLSSLRCPRPCRVLPHPILCILHHETLWKSTTRCWNERSRGTQLGVSNVIMPLCVTGTATFPIKTCNLSKCAFCAFDRFRYLDVQELRNFHPTTTAYLNDSNVRLRTFTRRLLSFICGCLASLGPYSARFGLPRCGDF